MPAPETAAVSHGTQSSPLDYSLSEPGMTVPCSTPSVFRGYSTQDEQVRTSEDPDRVPAQHDSKILEHMRARIRCRDVGERGGRRGWGKEDKMRRTARRTVEKS